jgi:hypothetical protein
MATPLFDPYIVPISFALLIGPFSYSAAVRRQSAVPLDR